MPVVYYSRRSRRAPEFVANIDYREPVPQWKTLARRHGFTYVGRNPDKRAAAYLRCCACGAIMSVHTHTLRSARPECTSCYMQAMGAEASAAGLIFIDRDPNDSHRGIYQASCGHTVNRQRVFVQQVGRGEDKIRCETCLEERYFTMADALGWALLGPTTNRRAGYRSFRHACGHVQNVAIANLATGRFSCNGCAGNWGSEPSALYVFRFDVPDEIEPYVKLGMSKNPSSRLRHQLGLAEGVDGELLMQVRVKTGAEALRIEKQMHKFLAAHCPDSVVQREDLWWICVTSEIYRLDALPQILNLLANLKSRTRS